MLIAPASRHVTMMSYPGNAGSVTVKKDGDIFRDSAVAIVHIKDGTSNTLLLGNARRVPI
jgi:hypothetical protein